MFRKPIVNKGDILRPKANGDQYCRVVRLEWSNALGKYVIHMAKLSDNKRTCTCPDDMIEMLYDVIERTELSEMLFT